MHRLVVQGEPVAEMQVSDVAFGGKVFGLGVQGVNDLFDSAAYCSKFHGMWLYGYAAPGFRPLDGGTGRYLSHNFSKKLMSVSFSNKVIGR